MNGVFFEVPEGGRLCCLADPHGDDALLRRVIGRMALTDRDVLCVLGDFSNKGPGNLQCVSYLMDLQRDRPNTLVLAGNGEYYNTRAFAGGDLKRILEYNRKWPADNLFLQWAGQCGFSTVDEENIQKVQHEVLRAFAGQVQWMLDLPLYAQSARFFLVHSGLTQLPSDGEAPLSCLRDNDFVRQGENRTGRIQIVGHWPVCNEPPGLMNPLWDGQRRLLAIDGGVGVMGRYAQLNGVVLDGPDASFFFEAENPLFEAAQDVLPPQRDGDALILHWDDGQVRVLDESDGFFLCRMEDGRAGWYKKEHLRPLENGLWAMRQRSRGALLPLKRGQRVQLLDTVDGWAYARTDQGVLGFVPAGALRPAAEETAPFSPVHALKIQA